jgi:hypothetical protein
MLRTAVLAIVTVGAITWAASAAAQVYKCTQDGGRVLYSDMPCKGGAAVDVRAGTANPAAVTQLARDNAAFDRKMAARRAAEDQAEFRRQRLDAQLETAKAAQGGVIASDSGPYYYAPGNAFVAAPHVKRQAHSHHARTAQQEHRVPAISPPPSGVRRRNQ